MKYHIKLKRIEYVQVEIDVDGQLSSNDIEGLAVQKANAEFGPTDEVEVLKAEGLGLPMLSNLLGAATDAAPTPRKTGREHELKTWPEFYSLIESGEKTFELRKDDRGFRAGDSLWLREWSPRTKQYTGREMTVLVTYVLSGWGLTKDFVAMGIRREELVLEHNRLKAEHALVTRIFREQGTVAQAYLAKLQRNLDAVAKKMRQRGGLSKWHAAYKELEAAKAAFQALGHGEI